jgi:S1-C subfamily serine protease
MNKLAVILLGFAGGLAGAFLLNKMNPQLVFVEQAPVEPTITHVNYKGAANISADFVKASQASTQGVVFIKTLTNQRAYQDPFYDFWSGMDFFGRRGPVASSGSGVILSADGYIVTNFHVVKGADQIEVITNNNKQSYPAKIIGTDPSSDLALLKI